MIARIRKLEADLAGSLDATIDQAALDVMAQIPREDFVSRDLKPSAYADAPLHIGQGQTISQPFIVALMTSLARLAPQSRVLEIGTGSGYQTAVLAALSAHVYSIEALPSLAANAKRALDAQGVRNVTLKVGDGRIGWTEFAPFDAIVVTAAPAEIPQRLVAQLTPDGRLVIPVGTSRQTLMIFDQGADGHLTSRSVLDVRFVPLTGPENYS